MSGMTVKIDTNSLMPPLRNPYYIVSPPYTRTSAGVTVLHLLCHFLNISGRNAYMAHHPQFSDNCTLLPSSVRLQKTGDFPPGMIAPLVTQQVVEAYDELRLTPIVIYPEIFDNVFEARFFVRYALNYPGLLGQIPEQSPDFCVAYTKNLGRHIAANDTLYVCTADLSYWNTTGAATTRTGTCYYAGKTQGLMSADLRDAPAGSVEIKSANMTRDEIRQIFWQSETFYCFEDTALATESQLCGCPVTFIPTKYFSGIQLAQVELGDDGACLIGEPDGLVRAKRTVGNVEARIRTTFAEFPPRIIELAEKLEALVKDRSYQGTICLPSKPRLVYFDPKAKILNDPTVSAQEPLRVDLTSMHDDIAAVHADLAVVHADLVATLRTNEQLEGEIRRMQSNISWRCTAPLRRLIDWWQSLRNGLQHASES